MSLPVTAHQQLVVIPDAAFSPYMVPGNPRAHTYLEFYPERQYAHTMVIAPHHHEAWLNTHLFKIALFCRANNIKLVSIGHENQLPFFGMFSDAVILQKGSLHELFGWFSTFSTDTRNFDKIPGWVDVYKHDDLPWDALPVPVEQTVPDARAKFRSPWRAIYGHYPAEHVIAVFSDCRIFIREASKATFDRLNDENKLPRQAIWCEVKEKYGKMNARLENLRAAGLPLVGVNKQLQRDLVREHGADFMTLQILCSLRNECRMLLGAGSAHVFAVAPANHAMALAPADRFYDAETEYIVRKFNQHRFGAVPYVEEATLTFLCTEDPRQYSPKREDEHIAHWQLDYFLPEEALRAYLECALAIPPRTSVEEVTWEAFRAERRFDPFTSGRQIRFQRGSGEHLSDVILEPDGTLTPRSTNETYWSQVGDRLAFKMHLGQTATVFRPENDSTLSGCFIYNQPILHQLLLIP
jgi:hypothetical protein